MYRTIQKLVPEVKSRSGGIFKVNKSSSYKLFKLSKRFLVLQTFARELLNWPWIAFRSPLKLKYGNSFCN